MDTHRPIGIFDSGVGGLSILNEIHVLLPDENLLYFADQAHVPYGSRSLVEVRDLSEGIVRFLIHQDAKAIVVACNTASAASLHQLRETFQGVQFIGMEPAVKPAVQHSQTGVVGVLATPATFLGEPFASVVERFAEGVEVLEATLPGLVELIEAGELEGSRVESILRTAVEPLITRGADTLVLACTHYPIILPVIQSIAGEGVTVIDPAPAIARQTGHVLDVGQALANRDGAGLIQYVTSGQLRAFEQSLQLLNMPAGSVRRARWQGGDIHLA